MLFWELPGWVFLGLLTEGGEGEEVKKALLPKICRTYPKMIKLGTLMPYLKEIQKIYKSRDTLLELCSHQQFFTGNQQILVYQEIQI